MVGEESQMGYSSPVEHQSSLSDPPCERAPDGGAASQKLVKVGCPFPKN